MNIKNAAPIVLTAILLGCGRPADDTSAHKAASPSFTDREFRELVKPGRTIAEVTNRLGVPTAVTEEAGRIVMAFSNMDTDLMSVEKKQEHTFGTYSITFTNGAVDTFTFSGHTMTIDY